jgi:hypothetical protein
MLSPDPNDRHDERKRRGLKTSMLAATGVFALAAVIFWIFAGSGFSLSYAACGGTFSLDASLVRCQRPVVFLWLFWISIGLTISSGATALYIWFVRRR